MPENENLIGASNDSDGGDLGSNGYSVVNYSGLLYNLDIAKPVEFKVHSCFKENMT